MIEVKALNISVKQGKEEKKLVNNLNFKLGSNKVLGIVGESGSGKSLTAMALSGLLNPKVFALNGEVSFYDEEIKLNNPNDFKNRRGKEIGVIFQEPMSSLNPSMTCGKQVTEMLLNHSNISNNLAKDEVIRLFNRVKLPRAKTMFNQYPHQLSGGQKQRVMIALAMACKPKLLIADEPTTALDVSVQKEFVQLLKSLQEEGEMALIFISHDLKLVENIADDILVMYKGNVEEFGQSSKIFKHPESNYTKALLAVRPNSKQRLLNLPTVTSFMSGSFFPEIESKTIRSRFHEKLYSRKPILVVKSLTKFYKERNNNWFKKKKPIRGIEKVCFELYPGETFGIVGPSGCGKSTLSRCILGLEKVSEGEILFENNSLIVDKNKALKIQMVFQDPYASLNPLMCIGKSILEPIAYHKIYNKRTERLEAVKKLLIDVGLSAEDYFKFPHEFSGGQRQRIVLARALALDPKIVIFDESVAALDVSVQAQILNLINSLKKKKGFSCIFIAHDLDVVRYMSDRVAVMHEGVIVEMKEADELFEKPTHKATKKLINDIL